MVDIMSEVWGDMLVNMPLSSDESGDHEKTPLPTPDQLRHKILIKVKYSPPKPPSTGPVPQQLTKKEEPVTSSSSSSSDSDLETAQAQPQAPRSKIIDALSKLGIYTRSVHFKSFDQPGSYTQFTFPPYCFG